MLFMRPLLISFGLPRAQQNERSALCLLALLDLQPDRKWAKAKNPLMGITPIMDWIRDHYQKPMLRTPARPCAAHPRGRREFLYQNLQPSTSAMLYSKPTGTLLS